MAKHNNNLAYDYSDYDDEDMEVKTERKIRHRANPEAGRSSSSARSLAVAVAAMVILGSMIYGRVEMTRLYAEQSEMQAELDQILNENISLESQLAQKTGLTKVEDYAENQLGLKKLDKSQIEYVEIESEPVAEVVPDDNDNIFVRLKRWLGKIKEYIGA